MIFLDVTGACRLRLQTGIPRTSRAIHSLLKQSGEHLLPLAWQPFLHSYTELSPAARRLLEDPFDSPGISKAAAPRDATFPFLGACLRDLLAEHPKRVPIDRHMQEGDTLLITSVFPDNRLEFLRSRVGKPGKLIGIFHDAIPLMDRDLKGWEKGRQLASLRLFGLMDLVICVSQKAEEELHHVWSLHKIPPAKTLVLTWPVPFSTARPPFVEPASKRATILYVARLKNTKNHARLLDASEALWRNRIDFQLNLIGCEDEERESRKILRRIRRLQEMGFPVRWLGHVSDEDLHRAYQECSFTVFPSLVEGLGLPILESLWHSRPVICSSERPMSEIGRGPGCLLVDVQSTEALQSAMGSLLCNPDEILRMAREASVRALRSWTDYAREFLPALAQHQ